MAERTTAAPCSQRRIAQRLRTVAPALWLLQSCDVQVEGNLGAWHASHAGQDAAIAMQPGATGVGDTTFDAGTTPSAHTDDLAGSDAHTATGTMEPSEPEACALARPGAAPLEVTVIETNAVMYNFAGGAAFPAGRYRIEYVDGCRRYDNTAAWTLHASLLAAGLSSEGRGGCYMIMSNDRAVELAPGTAGVVVGEGPDPAGAFASYDECVAANRMQAPRELTFSTGTIGIMNAGDSSSDKTTGEAIGRRSPTYRLTRLDACP
jgi:hypothetical protein